MEDEKAEWRAGERGKSSNGRGERRGGAGKEYNRRERERVKQQVQVEEEEKGGWQGVIGDRGRTRKRRSRQ